MPQTDAANFALTLGDILKAAGVEDLRSVLVIRHTYNAEGLSGPSDLTPQRVLEYTRVQSVRGKFPAVPPPLWLLFVADGGRSSRFLWAYENHGELEAHREGDWRTFDLRPSGFMDSLRDRLVVEWSRDTVNWAKSAATAAAFPVMEIADPAVVPFPGYDRLFIDYGELQKVVEDRRYRDWRTALGAVQGIYLIADEKTGKLYVGKADGAERILGRWTAYARSGHGGNVALRAAVGLDADHPQHFKFSILRVFGPNATTAEVDQAEAHYKRALLSRTHGYNRN